MRVSQINNTNFGGNPLRIIAAENKQIGNLTNIVMEATSRYGAYRSGTVLYRLGKEIEISDPAKGLAEFLQKLGIKINI